MIDGDRVPSPFLLKRAPLAYGAGRAGTLISPVGSSLPRLSTSALIRPRLDSRLSSWAPLTVVRGLRGFGKTTQVATWLAGHDPERVTSVWVVASPMSDEAQSFEDRLSDSLCISGVIPSAPAHLRRNGLEDLSSALLATSSEHKFILVVDDFHHVRDERVLEELVGLVERHRNFHLYVCCQGHHRIESLAKGKIDLNAVEARELLLEVGEISELARSLGVPLTTPESERLRDALGGCVAMTRLALENGQALAPRPVAAEEYIRTQLLGDFADESLKEHLMHFSLVEAVCWGVFRDLCDDPDPSRLLEDLEATGLVERTSEGDQVLFFIRAPLRETLRAEFNISMPERMRAFHCRLAAWYSEHGEASSLPAAFQHAVEGRDWPLMDRIWSESLMSLIAEGAASCGRAWTRSLPQCSRPDLRCRF